MKAREMYDFSNKTIIITGASGGIGTALSRELDRRGAKLVLADINFNGLESSASGLTSNPLIIKCDITDRADVKTLVESAVNRFLKIDILINNAGIIRPALFENCSYENIDDQMKVNFIGAVNCTKEVLAVMIPAKRGHIVTISSLAGLVPETYSSIYTASKFALRGFFLTLGIELRKHNIKVSTIFPDSVDTPMLKYEASHGGSPLTFLGDPQSPGKSPEKIVKAVIRAIEKGSPEICSPASTGTFSRIIMCWPWLVTKLWPLLERLGEKNKKTYIN
ncbi:MAG: SDR family NAD(P)-dependent oxidoreductase [Chloroflexi bacterium]|nr:SDR family NAD(P)-dependent oxidoreductase [Chloroflexota bacterium]